MKPSIVIRMGASRFDATVANPAVGEPIKFDLYRMNERDRHKFRRTLVASFREAQQS